MTLLIPELLEPRVYSEGRTVFMSEMSAVWEEIIEPGASWSHVLKRGTSLRVTDIEGNANVGVIFYNFECPAERFNLGDTLKAQHISRLTKGCVLYSDMGRILCSITEDTVGWHDPLGGCSDASLVTEKYGEASYQQFHNRFHRNARESFLIELEKWGLGARDLAANVNLFSRVTVDDDGRMIFQPRNSISQSYMELRAEMNVLLILNTCPHPLDPNPNYEPKPVRLSIRNSSLPGVADACRRFRPENARGFMLTERYFL